MRSPSRHALTLLLALFLAGPWALPAAHAEMYKWVDEQGVTHYTQTPPPGNDFKEVAPPPPPAVDPGQAARQLKESQKAFDERRKEAREAADKQAKAEAEAAERSKQCEQARRNLENLLTHPRIRYTDDSGEVTLLPEEERQKRIAEAREQIEELCD